MIEDKLGFGCLKCGGKNLMTRQEPESKVRGMVSFLVARGIINEPDKEALDLL